MNTIHPKSAEEAYALILREAEDRAMASPRIVRRMEVGQVVRQGDIYIHRVADDHRHGEKIESRQLAVGDTQGSRHVAEGDVQTYSGTHRPDWCAEGTLLGPVVVATGRWTVTHPEHAHVECPAGIYQITHQMDARTLDRVRD